VRWIEQVYGHAFAHDWLPLDIDLTACTAQWVE
jgi:hypothetical protein